MINDEDREKIRTMLWAIFTTALAFGFVMGLLFSMLIPPLLNDATTPKEEEELIYTAVGIFEDLVIVPIYNGSLQIINVQRMQYAEIWSNTPLVMFEPSESIHLVEDGYVFAGGSFIVQCTWFKIISAEFIELRVYKNDQMLELTDIRFWIENGDIIIHFDIVV